MIPWFVLALLAMGVGWAVCVEPRRYRVRRISVTLAKPLARPFTILHLSDIHIHKEDPRKRRFFQELSALSPDLVCLTGDIIDSPSGISIAEELLGNLKPRFGFWAVLGNHDYFNYGLAEALWFHVLFPGWPVKRMETERLVTALERIGCKVLRNESAVLEAGSLRLLLFGLDDPVTRRADVKKTFTQTPAADVRILLAHLLDPIREVPEGAVDLALAGHTHGGQVRVPFLGPIVTDSKLPNRFARGVESYRGVTTVVSQGMGQSHYLPIRFCCPPEALWIEVQGG